MKYLFTNVLGSFVFDASLHVHDSIEFKTVEEFNQKQLSEQKLQKKHPDLIPLPAEKIAEVLSHFKQPKYFSQFYQANLVITKKAIKESVSDDILIMQTIANVNELDKIANMLSKRLREWFSLYLPEFSQKMQDHQKFAELVAKKSKEELLKDISLQEEQSMGAVLSQLHVDEMKLLAEEVGRIYLLRQEHEQYLQTVMKEYCPNLLELAGATIGAKLMELGRGLKHIAMLPASTIQLLGAEKALFRHIKTGARSPKYGIIINHPFIQKAPKDKKGKAARMLADKLVLCTRLDYFKGEFKAPEFQKDLEEKIAK